MQDQLLLELWPFYTDHCSVDRYTVPYTIINWICFVCMWHEFLCQVHENIDINYGCEAEKSLENLQYFRCADDVPCEMFVNGLFMCASEVEAGCNFCLKRRLPGQIFVHGKLFSTLNMSKTYKHPKWLTQLHAFSHLLCVTSKPCYKAPPFYGYIYMALCRCHV